jgi:hypothetical protein
MAKVPQIKKEAKASLLCYISNTHHTCLDKLYKGKVPKKDNPNGSYIVKTGIVKGNLFWYDEPIVFSGGEEARYWPLGVSE